MLFPFNKSVGHYSQISLAFIIAKEGMNPAGHKET